MPTYEYQCRACGHTLEVFQRMSEAPLTECPKCHKKDLEKLISAASFQLKGGGWYKTDYSSKDKTSAKTTETSDDNKTSDAGSEAKKEATDSSKDKT